MGRLEKFKKYKDEDLIIELFENSHKYSPKEINEFFLEIALREKDNLNLNDDFEVVVSRNFDEMGEESILSDENEVFISTKLFPFYKKSFEIEDYIIILQILFTVLHELEHVRQLQFYEENIEDYIVNFPFYSDNEIMLMNNLLYLEKGKVSTYHDMGSKKYLFDLQINEYMARVYSVSKCRELIEKAGTESENKDIYFNLAGFLSAYVKNWKESCVKSAKSDFPNIYSVEKISELQSMLNFKMNDKAFKILNESRNKLLKNQKVEVSYPKNDLHKNNRRKK